MRVPKRGYSPILMKESILEEWRQSDFKCPLVKLAGYTCLQMSGGGGGGGAFADPWTTCIPIYTIFSYAFDPVLYYRIQGTLSYFILKETTRKVCLLQYQLRLCFQISCYTLWSRHSFNMKFNFSGFKLLHVDWHVVQLSTIMSTLPKKKWECFMGHKAHTCTDILTCTNTQ